MISEVSWDSLWTLSFGLSQFHGHGFWLVCEVALIKVQEHTVFIPTHWPPAVFVTGILHSRHQGNYEFADTFVVMGLGKVCVTSNANHVHQQVSM